MRARPHLIRERNDDTATVEFYCGASAPLDRPQPISAADPATRRLICPDCLAAFRFAVGEHGHH